MKASYYFLFGFLFLFQITFSQVGIGTTAPDATLDIKASNPVTPANNDGILIPKVDAFPVTNPTIAQEGMLIFLRVASGSNLPGFYYWNGVSAWIGIQGSAVKDWGLTGNAGTLASTNFLGTTDNIDFVIKRNGIRAGFIGDPDLLIGNKNTSFGAGSLLVATGTRNTAFGSNVLPINVAGASNVSIGNETMVLNIAGTDNTAVGTGALYSNTASFNTAIGRNALTTNSTGASNTAIGLQAMLNSSTGSFNTAVGRESLRGNTTGANNSTIGVNSMLKNTTGANNTVIGVQALRANTIGNNNTALGYQALSGNASVLANVTTGDNNTAIGYQSFYNNLVGANNVGLGYQAGFGELTSNKLYIENSSANADNALIYGEFDTNILRTNSQFQIGNPTVTGYSFPTTRPATAAGQVLQYNAAGALTFQAPSTALNSYAWLTTGNSGMTANFIGTTDANPLNFRTTNLDRMRLLADGKLAINTPAAPVASDLVTITSSGTMNYPFNSYNTLATGSAIYGSNASTTVTTSGIEGATNSVSGSGIYGVSYGASGITTIPAGITGSYSGTSTSGVRIGVRGLSSNGSGSQQIGVYGTYSSGPPGPAAFGIGVIGVANGGGIPSGNFDFGVIGWAGNNQNYSGYFNGNHVIANGTKSASVGTDKGNQLLYVTEAPEVWFEDLGGGQLVNGQTHISLDSMYLQTIFVDNTHPMRIFLQEEGESNGLIVIKDADNKGFTVKEKNSGTSNISFSYRIMAKRLHFQDHRFGNDPVWGEGDTRKYNQYASPPPVDYNKNVLFQTEQKRNYKPTPMPEGFIDYMKLQEINKKSETKKR